jgi:heme-degrading monooxygenase HmoA
VSPQILTVFRSRLAPGTDASYAPLAAAMMDLARSMEGFVDAKTFAAADGERVTIVTFADRAAHEAWRDHPSHVEAQRRGRAELYERYEIHVAEVTSSRSWPAE